MITNICIERILRSKAYKDSLGETGAFLIENTGLLLGMDGFYRGEENGAYLMNVNKIDLQNNSLLVKKMRGGKEVNGGCPR